MDQYEVAEGLLSAVEGRISADPHLTLLAAQTRATLALVDRIEYLTYLLYGEDE